VTNTDSDRASPWGSEAIAIISPAFVPGFPFEDHMVEFTNEKLRHYCRNPRCRSKLPAPVANEREAFCCRGCHSSFYRHRCLICEAPMERKTERQLICGKRACRNALQVRSELGRYMPLSGVVSPLEKSTKLGIKSPLTGDQGWRIVAGQMSPSAFHCATVADGGEHRRIEAKNRIAIKAAEQAEVEAGGYFTEPDWPGWCPVLCHLFSAGDGN
jgi:hypothetical protein